MANQQKQKKIALGERLHGMFMGSFVSLRFVKKHWITLFVSLVLIMTFISTKYQCMTDMETIANLRKELDVAQTERIREQSTFRSRIRESAMQEMVDSLLPGLGVQEQPPFVLK